MSNKKFNLIFVGTPDFGLLSLKKIKENKNFNIVAVITQPDKRMGRKMKKTSPPIKIEAKKYNIPIFQPDKIIEIEKELKELKPDIIVVIAYGQIIPEKILILPKYYSINVHASLLPKYRGASCIQAPLLNGDSETGITIMKMEKGLDTGPILKQDKIQIKKDETAESLHDKLSKLSSDILSDTLIKYIEGKIKPEKQSKENSSYVKILKKEDGKINWNKEAIEIERMIRALNPWPGTYTKIEEKNLILKILEVKNEPLKINKYKPGFFFLEKNKLFVQCGKNSLAIKKLQLSGKKAMKAEDFLKGNKNIIIKELS